MNKQILTLITLQIIAACHLSIAAENTDSLVNESIYYHKTYHFSFVMPINWKKHSGQLSSDNALFMPLPLNQSCSFQFNVTPMPAHFSVAETVKNLLKLAYRELKEKKLLAVKLRNTVIKTPLKEHSKEDSHILTYGWEILTLPEPHGRQKLIYQVYDRENHYFQFIAAASSEKFANCSTHLYKIIDSIHFDSNIVQF
jgi:hypothetical protein